MEPIDILLVEDDPVEVLLAREAFEDFKLRNHVVALGDGRAALAYLNRTGPYRDVRLPGLILLDLNLPGLDGRELLERLAADPVLAAIPVVVLTSSLAERDILRARRLRVTDYMIKPVDFHRIVDVVRHVEQLGFAVLRTAATG
ncbi:response regulator [Luedemannella helvata]|uniref:Response regulator n=1 Tax=Luedemannella helvata TaxID=349315 RepID=A0ABN2KHJ4_9ACTN